jgi:glucose/arabinose dehydrogenase
MGYSVVNVDEIEGSGPSGAVHFVRQVVAGPDGIKFVSVGARRGAYQPRGPF